MAVLKSQLHLWTLKNHSLISETGLGCLTYHDKNDKGATSSTLSGSSTASYTQDKQLYVESHGKVWTPSNKRPDKLRDHIKEFEDSINSSSGLYSWWRSEDTLLVLLTNGTLFWISIDQSHGDITKITKDTSLVGRLSVTSLCDVAFAPTFLALCSSDTSKLEIVHLSKGSLVDNSHKKLSALEPKIHCINLPGRPGRSLNRRMQVSPAADSLLIYWPIASEEAWPWAPMSNDEERANLCIISLAGGKPIVSAYTKTESDPLHVVFRLGDSSKLQSVERSINCKSARADLCTYEMIKSNIHRTHHNIVPLSSTLTGARWDNYQHSLVLSCEDNFLLLYSESMKNLIKVKSEFHADFMEWHPTGGMVLVLNQKGDMQIFDKALTCLNLTLQGLEFVPHIRLSNFFRSSPQLKGVSWCDHNGQAVSTRNTLLLTFDRGPLALMKFTGGHFGASDITCELIVAEYIRSNNFSQATKLLTVMSWEKEGASCFRCLVNIMNCLLRQPLSKETEDLLEATLGCFYAPHKPLAEVAILEYRIHIGYLARRFFHHLVRYSRFDKAFLLAVDINAKDLFMDIYYAALDLGQHRLAAAAKHKAQLCEEELMFSDSGSSLNDGDLPSDEFYSGASSEGSLVDSRERAEAIVLARVNGHTPPLPPRKSSRKITPPIPPRGNKGDVTSLHKTPSSGGSTPPLPPRVKQALSSEEAQADESYSSKVEEVNKYQHVSGCTLPSGYSYELSPQVSQRIIDDFNSMIVDGENIDYNQIPELQPSNQNIEKKPVKVIHFGLV